VIRLRTAVWVLFSFMLAAMASFGQQASGRLPLNAVIPLGEGTNTSYGKLPLVFEANQGQADTQVKFLFRGRGYTAFLTSGSMVLSLRPTTVAPTQQTGAVANNSNLQPVAPTTLQFRLLGAAENPAVAGENQQPGRVNYFIGNDPASWRTNVPTYASVRYKNVYPGVDLVYYGNHRQLEYDFVVSPGADPSRIEFEIQGATQIQLDAEGNLALQTSSGNLHFQSPAVYQESNGQRLTVYGSYILKDPTHVAFRLAQYDPSKPLVIDPVLVYGTYLGGSGADQASGIAVDGTGSVYIAGYTDSADFLLTTFGAPSTNANHVFVAKFDSTGSNLVYADYIGGNGQDYGIGLALDSANNVYVTGSTTSSNFPTAKPYQAVEPGSYSGFLSKISADGSSLSYSTYLGGNGVDQPASITVDTLDEAYIAGTTTSQNFPVVNAYQTAALANQDGLFGNYGFVTKFTADGSSLIYSTYLAGNSNVVQNCGTPCWPTPYTAVSAVALDANGSAYVTGTTNTYNFPVTSGAYLTSNSTQQDATTGFVSKFASSGSLDYSTYFYGSSGNPIGIGAITVDGSGSAYIAGTVASDGTFPITSTGICDPSVSGFGCSYAFVTKFDPTASTLLYSTFLGPNNYASPQSIALDPSNNAYVAANTHSAAFGTNNGIEGYTNGFDILLVEIDASATTELFATYLGGSGNDFASGVALDVNGSIYVAGFTDSADFPVTQGAFQDLLGGTIEAFVMKIGSVSAPAVSLSPPVLQYASLQVGLTSPPQQVVLRNMGSSPLLLSSISATGDFSETDNCGISVPAAASCTFSVTFTPTAVGLRSGSIVIQDDAAGSPHVINLSGSGSGTVAALTPASLAFSAQQVGASSASQAVTLTNSGSGTLSIGNIQVTGDYGQTNTCPATLASKFSCIVNITFTPTASGTRNGTLTINDNAQGSPQVANLAGVGMDFSLTSSQSSDTLKAGATATYQLAVSPVGGTFTNTVNLSCSGAPALATCNILPNAVTPNGSAATATLTITTTAAVAQSMPLFPSQAHPIYALWMQLQGIGVFGMILASSRSQSRKPRVIILLALMIAVMMFMFGCAGQTGVTTPPHSGTTSGTYAITVTGTSGALQHSLLLTLIVQ
jgi:hypothetical protein